MLSRHAKRAILGFSFAGIVLVIIGAATRHYFAGRALELRLEQERADMVPPEPLLFTVERSTRQRERSFAVRLQPYQRSAVAAETAGRIEEVLIDVGDFVEKDQVLFRIDPTLAQLNLEAARAALQAAEARLKEIERRVREAEQLAEARTIPRTELDAVRAEAEVQAAELERLRSELSRQEEILAHHEIRAPFAGNVNQRLVEVGDAVNVNQQVASLVTLDPLRVRFFVSDVEVQSFQPGDSLPLTVDSRPEDDFQVPVTSVADATDPVSGLFLIEGEVANPDRKLVGGAKGKVTATIAEYTDMLFVPAATVRFEGPKALVEVRVNGESEMREVELGPETDGFYPVLDGLAEGDVLVVR